MGAWENGEDRRGIGRAFEEAYRWGIGGTI